MAGNIKSKKAYVIDASYVLGFLLPDEENEKVDSVFAKFKEGKIDLFSTSLLPFEVLNGLRSVVIQKRLKVNKAEVLAEAFLELGIELKGIDLSAVFRLALESGLTVYDASYVWLSQKLGTPLLSMDKKLKKR